MSLLGEELRPGLRCWETRHGEWGKAVRSFALLTEERLVLIDPLLVGGQWDELQFLRGDLPLEILMTVHWHARSIGEIRERFPDSSRARCWSRDRPQVEHRVAVDGTFELGEPLPGGLVAIHAAPLEEVFFWDAGRAALISGDLLLGAGESGEGHEPIDHLHLCPESWLPGRDGPAVLHRTIREVLELPIEIVLPSHGRLVLGDGRAALRLALDRAVATSGR
jgi:hypothetical protein